jgi:hypothetical protein
MATLCLPIKPADQSAQLAPHGPPASITEKAALARSVDSLQRDVCKRWPKVFNPVQPVPIAINVHIQIAHATGVDIGTVSAFLFGWCRSENYLRAVLQGGSRCGPDGEPAGRVDQRSRVFAANMLRSRRKKPSRRTAG